MVRSTEDVQEFDSLTCLPEAGITGVIYFVDGDSYVWIDSTYKIIKNMEIVKEEVVTNDVKIAELENKVKLAKDASIAFEESINKKLYAFELPGKSKDTVYSAFENMEWDGRGAMALSKIYDQVKNATVKEGCIFLTGTEIHAINYVTTKVKGVGVESARVHAEIVKSIISSVKYVEADRQELTRLEEAVANAERDLFAAQHGLEEEVLEGKEVEQEDKA